MYDRSLAISTMLFRAPCAFGSVAAPDVMALDRMRNAEGTTDPELNCARCWMPLTDDARCGNCGAHRT